MYKRLSSLILLLFSPLLVMRAQHAFTPRQWGDWQVWGEIRPTHCYVNPILPADFSDIDCIEHEGYYYAISSTFQFEPGMVVLRSADMVNWQIYSHAVADITQIGPALDYTQMNRYSQGIWAGALRYHEGRFYVYFGTPNEGMFMTTAKRIRGPWAPLTKMNFGEGWDDCCPLFDDPLPGERKGKKYFVATNFSDNYKTYIFHLSDDGTTVDWDTKVLVNEGYGREANKLYKWNGKYYHLFSEHKDDGRYLVMQRSDTPMGPYTERRRLCYTQRAWNEPNQGGYLQDAAGNWFFMTHHGSGDWGGREASLLPVTWTQDGWPIIGQSDSANIGSMVWSHPMPVTRQKDASQKSQKDVAVTDFVCEDWEWNYHPNAKRYVRKADKLVLKAMRPLEKDNLLKAPNTLTLRSWQTPYNEAVVRLDISRMEDGQRSGICHFSSPWSEFGVSREEGASRLYFRRNDGDYKVLMDSVPDAIYLRSTWGLDAVSHYAYSLDGKVWHEGGTYTLQWGNYRGDRLGLYTYNNIGDTGQATFTHFRYVAKRDNVNQRVTP